MTPARLRRSRGFTLTELMVVVAIVGIMVTMAIVYMRPRVRPIDAATRVGDLVREGSRRAVALGSVRADVAKALNSKARTQVMAWTSGAFVTFTLYRLEEDLPDGIATANWVKVEEYTVHRNVQPMLWAPDVGDRTMTGQTGTWDSPNAGVPTFVATPVPPGPPPGLIIRCRPDGTCDSTTMFFQANPAGPDCATAPAGPLNDWCAKLSVMPLGGAITLRPDWN